MTRWWPQASFPQGTRRTRPAGVYQVLWRAHGDAGRTAHPAPGSPWDDLAALADVARENVSRLLGELEKGRIIDRHSSLGFVIHKERLEREAGVFRE